MKISLTVGSIGDEYAQEQYKTCDLVFITTGYPQSYLDEIEKVCPGKTVTLKYIGSSRALLKYLETGEYGYLSPKEMTEFATVKAMLPKNTPIEFHSMETIDNYLPPNCNIK